MLLFWNNDPDDAPDILIETDWEPGTASMPDFDSIKAAIED